jgi:hypothetical protein
VEPAGWGEVLLDQQLEVGRERRKMKIKKPSLWQFWIGYGCAWVLAQATVVRWEQAPRLVFLEVAIVNLSFALANMIGTCFAAYGYVPWCNCDKQPIRRVQVVSKVSASDTMTIIVDSYNWTGRR